jgi:diacylglycerol kinase (ATP)
MTIDGEATELDLMLIALMNTKRTGVGLRLAPYAQLDDGKIDVVYNKNRIAYKMQALRIDKQLKKGGSHVHNPDIGYATVSSTFELTAPKPIRLMCDGDALGFTPMKVTVLPGAFALFTAKETPEPRIQDA